MAYSNYEDWKKNQGMGRTMDFQDSDRDGTDDRDQAGAGGAHFKDQYIADGYTPGMGGGQGPGASEPQPPTNNPSNGNSAPQTPSNNVSNTTPDPQEFADQKKAEVKQSYSTSKSDRINNAYRDHYGRNAHADEISNWTGTGMGIEDIQKGLKTSFARDGEHLSGDALAALQIQQPSQPSAPTPTPEPTPPPTDEDRLDEIDNRFAGSDAFYERLKESNSPITPDNNQSSSNNSNNQQSDGIGDLQQMHAFNQSVRDSKGYLSRNDQFKGSVLAMEDAKNGSGFDPMAIAQQGINMNDANNPINGPAVGQKIEDMIQNFQDQATLNGVRNWGDRDARAPIKWADRRPTEQYTPPDFSAIADEQQDRIRDIYK